MEKLMAGIDLHSNNLVIGIVNDKGQRIKHQKLDCNLENVLEFLDPYKDQLEGVAIESTFNWYWLLDGLREHSFPAELANPAKMDQYSGIKHADDKSDAFFLAELLRLGIMPTGYVYDPQLRPVRDLLRRRAQLVRQRTSLILSMQSLHQRTTGRRLNVNRLKAMDLEDIRELYEHPANELISVEQKRLIQALEESIRRIERAVWETASELPYYAKLRTLPGFGFILALTITMEVGDIRRFGTPGEFASYCRTVDSKQLSNGKKKGENNGKCGNKYLAWAFVEGANFSKRYDSNCRRWFDRKASKTHNVIATKALACKLAKSAWHVMSHGTDYDPGRMFPELAAKNKSF